MTDTVTILRSPGRYATKQFTMGADGKIVSRGYDEAKHFRVYERTVSSLATLGQLLDRISIDPFSTVIRGKPLAGIDRKFARRLLHEHVDDDGVVSAPTFEACARQWLLLDVDKIEQEPPCDPSNGPALARWIIGLLPPEFAGAAHWWAFTSSAGIKPGVRMRLAFWLERAAEQWELDGWFMDSPVDRSVFRPVQVVYLAAPIFRGMCDPVTRRSGIVADGAPAVEVPTIVVPQPEAAPVWLGQRSWVQVAEGKRTPESDLAAALRAVVSTPEAGNNAWGGVGRHHALFCATLSVCHHIERGRLSKARVKAELVAAAAGLDRQRELERHVDNAMRRGGVH